MTDADRRGTQQRAPTSESPAAPRADQRSGFAEVASARLYYQQIGAGESLVLIHGFSLDHRMWDPQMDALARRYRVLRYDCRGFGRSAPTTGEPYRHHEDLRALLVSFGIRGAVVVGMSLGGGTAIDFALAYPEMTRALVLIDSTLGGYRWSDEFIVPIKACSATAKASGVDAAREVWYAHPMFASAQGRPDVMARLRAIVGDYSGWHWLNADPRRSFEPPAITHLRDLTVPVLTIVGERDIADFHAIARLIEEQAPNARRLVVPDAGHLANMEAPDAVGEAILRFVADLSAGNRE